MKKLLVLLTVLSIMLSTCIMGIGTTASALETSPESDFVAFDGVLEEYIGPGGVVVIPAEIDGEPLTEIAAQAFINNTDITEVYIPEGIEVIGNRAFYQCKNLYKVEFPYSLYQFGSETFTSCSLEAVTVPGSVEKVAYNTFGDNKALKDIVISYGVREIHSNAFGFTFPERVVFPETVELIAAAAFNYLQNQTRVEFVICNPNLTLGVKVVSGGLWKEMMNGQWTNDIFRPWNSSLGAGKTNFKVVVPEGSKIAEFVKDWKNNKLLDPNEAGSCENSYTVQEQDEEFFDELEENQKDWGITKTRADLSFASGGSSADDGNNGASDDGDDGNDDNNGNNGSSGNKNNGTSGNKNNNKNNGGSSTTTLVEEGDNSLIVTVLIVGGIIFLIIIVGAVVFAVIFLKKPKKAPAAPQVIYMMGPDGKIVPVAAEQIENPTEEAPVEEAAAEETPEENE